MPDPRRDAPTDDDPNRSGARRIAPEVRVGDELPPTPAVVRQRPRIVTGQYSIVIPKPPKATNE